MTHLFDTNSCVDHLRGGQDSNITARLTLLFPAASFFVRLSSRNCCLAHTKAHGSSKL